MSLIPEDANNAGEDQYSEESEGDVEREADQVDIHGRLLFQGRLTFVFAVGALNSLRLPHPEVLYLPLLLLEGV